MQDPFRALQDPFRALYDATHRHRASHGCGAYPFNDGPALGELVAGLAPARILELGAALGYTACWFAHSAPAALIDSIDSDGEHVRLAGEAIAEAGFAARVTLHRGDFVEVMERLRGDYDLAFFDGYAPERRVFEALTRRLKPGAVLISANLGLGGAEVAAVRRDLMDPSRWRTRMALEDARTAVSAKV